MKYYIGIINHGKNFKIRPFCSCRIVKFITWNTPGAPVAPTTKAHGMPPGYCKHGRRFDKDYKEKIKSQWNFWQMPPPPYERRAIDKFLTLPEGVIHKLRL